MAASVNRVILVANLGRDPETRYMPNGDAVTNCTVATTDSWKDKTSGEKKEATEWHRVVFFRKLAEIAGQFLKKGSQVYIEGSLKTRKWTDKDGQERYTTEIVADSMQMLGSRQGSGESSAEQTPQKRPAPQSASTGGGGTPARQPAYAGDEFGEDIPFVDCDAARDPLFNKQGRSRRLRV